MKIGDVKLPQDTIEANIRKETHGDLIEIEIEIQGDVGEVIYITPENAKKFGEHLISLSNQVITL